MNWMVFAGSLAAVLALGAVAWWLKLGGTDPAFTSAEDAASAADAALPGFTAHAALIAVDRRAALVLGADSRVAVLKAHGARAAAREVRWSDVRAIHGGIRVDTGERRFGAVTIEGVDALDIRRAGGDAMAPRR